jgi:hypothetical protein
MINRLGLAGAIQNLQPTNSKGTSSKNLTYVAGRVTDIILDENHPLFKQFGEWDSIGTVFFTILIENTNIGTTKIARPITPQIKSYPLINELIICFQLPIPIINSTNNKNEYYYLNSINAWKHPHHNAFPTPLNPQQAPSQNLSYQQVAAGFERKVPDDEITISLNSPLNPSQDTFIEKPNIHPLLSFAGDTIFEGRHGQSIRLGATAKSKSTYNNNWSDNGNNGEPIIILRNGQSPRASSEGWLPITEDIRNDLSSIYLTSFQRLKDFKVASELYNSYTTPPIAPSIFTSPQIAFNSDRIVINAKTDSILLSSQKSIGMSTNGSVNIDATSHYVNSNDIKLGSKNATQPVLLGDDTIELLRDLTFAVKDLATILQVQRDYPGGVLTTSFNSVAGNALICLDSIITSLNDNSLKSKTTKVQ